MSYKGEHEDLQLIIFLIATRLYSCVDKRETLNSRELRSMGLVRVLCFKYCIENVVQRASQELNSDDKHMNAKL